jgi:hypothetical protein
MTANGAHDHAEEQLMTTCACGNCQFYDTHSTTGSKQKDKHSGLCRFNPPMPSADANGHAMWPVVADKDWCGHFAVTVERFMTAAE